MLLETCHYLFCGIVRTQTDVKLCKQGGLSYTRVHKLLLQMLAELGLDPKCYTVLGLVVLLQLLVQEFLIDCLSDMDVGGVKMPWRADFVYLKPWV